MYMRSVRLRLLVLKLHIGKIVIATCHDRTHCPGTPQNGASRLRIAMACDAACAT
jgi:hypothetical protein